MSQKQKTEEPRGWFSEIYSFIKTLVVVAVGIALVATLFNGGLDGAEELLRGFVQWIFELVEKVIGAAKRIAEGVSQ